MFCWGFLPIKYSILIQYHENEGTEGLYLMLNVHLYGVEKLAVGEFEGWLFSKKYLQDKQSAVSICINHLPQLCL